MLVRSSSSDLASGAVIADHAHDWHQLIYVTAGVAVVTPRAGAWLAPPSWAVWVAAGERHAIRFFGRSSLRTLYVSPTTPAVPAPGCASLAVSPLLRELVVRTAELGMLDARVETEAALAALLVAELGRDGPPPFALPQPTSETMRRAARLIVASRAETGAMEGWPGTWASACARWSGGSASRPGSPPAAGGSRPGCSPAWN